MFCYAGIFVVAGITTAFNDFSTMWSFPPAPGGRVIFFARLVLFAEFVTLALRWVIGTHTELDMWILWLNNPFQRQEIYTAMFSLALVLGLLLAFPHRVVFITFFMTSYFLVDYWAQWLANDHFDRALRRTRVKHLSSTKFEVLKAMEYYWLRRPQLARVTTMMFFSSMAFSLALAGAFQQEPQRTRYQLAAYLLLILDLLVGESVVSWWRHKRNQAMRQAVGQESQ